MLGVEVGVIQPLSEPEENTFFGFLSVSYLLFKHSLKVKRFCSLSQSVYFYIRFHFKLLQEIFEKKTRTKLTLPRSNIFRVQALFILSVFSKCTHTQQHFPFCHHLFHSILK